MIGSWIKEMATTENTIEKNKKLKIKITIMFIQSDFRGTFLVFVFCLNMLFMAQGTETLTTKGPKSSRGKFQWECQNWCKWEESDDEVEIHVKVVNVIILEVVGIIFTWCIVQTCWRITRMWNKRYWNFHFWKSHHHQNVVQVDAGDLNMKDGCWLRS